MRYSSAAISTQSRAAMSHVVANLQSVAQPRSRQPTVRAATHGPGGARRQARAWAPCSATPGPGQEDEDATGAGPAPWSDFYSVFWDEPRRGGHPVPCLLLHLVDTMGGAKRKGTVCNGLNDSGHRVRVELGMKAPERLRAGCCSPLGSARGPRSVASFAGGLEPRWLAATVLAILAQAHQNKVSVQCA